MRTLKPLHSCGSQASGQVTDNKAAFWLYLHPWPVALKASPPQCLPCYSSSFVHMFWKQVFWIIIKSVVFFTPTTCHGDSKQKKMLLMTAGLLENSVCCVFLVWVLLPESLMRQCTFNAAEKIQGSWRRLSHRTSATVHLNNIRVEHKRCEIWGRWNERFTPEESVTVQCGWVLSTMKGWCVCWTHWGAF